MVYQKQLLKKLYKLSNFNLLKLYKKINLLKLPNKKKKKITLLKKE